jgi:hypothetical protein
MFEYRLRELWNKINFYPWSEECGGDYKYYILTNKEREIYFRNTNKSIEFIKHKFKNQKLAYFLIKLGILQLFLKSIKLHPAFGDVIFIGGQIKCFDLNDKSVMSFPLYDYEDEFFTINKKFQMKNKKYAPKILKGYIDGYIHKGKDYVYVNEELLEKYEETNYLTIFKKLYSFYEKNGIKKKKGLLYVTSHGDFSKENLLKRGNEIVFTDWQSRKDLITKDLHTFFIRDSKEKNPLENKEFLEVLKIYPKEVQENINKYIEINEKDWQEELNSYKMLRMEMKK